MKYCLLIEDLLLISSIHPFEFQVQITLHRKWLLARVNPESTLGIPCKILHP